MSGGWSGVWCECSFKKDSPLEVSNYRPISIVSNVLERSVYNQLYAFFTVTLTSI